MTCQVKTQVGVVNATIDQDTKGINIISDASNLIKGIVLGLLYRLAICVLGLIVMILFPGTSTVNFFLGSLCLGLILSVSLVLSAQKIFAFQNDLQRIRTYNILGISIKDIPFNIVEVSFINNGCNFKSKKENISLSELNAETENFLRNYCISNNLKIIYSQDC
jgi:hypothetical protein